ncbi:MAG: hypothetical protein ACYCYF_03270 [Anaerolineae bacterium]
MSLIRKAASLIAVLAIVMAAAGCHTGDPLEEVALRAGAEGVRLSLVLGPAVPVLRGEVPASGGVLSFDDLGDPLDGLVFEVRDGSYDHPVTVDITYHPIERESDLAGLDIISPLIVVEHGGQPSQEALVLRIPVYMRVRFFTSVYAYDDATGKIEALPVLEIDKNTVTVAAQNLSRLFVTEHALEDLDRLDVDSGYRPGVDTWQFQNQGSYLTPRGNGWGMSVSSLWYYVDGPRSNGNARLWGEYDGVPGADGPTPELWQDDVRGLGVATEIQRAYEQEREGRYYDLVYEMHRTDTGMVGLISLRLTYDEVTFYTVADAIALTHEPQLLSACADHGVQCQTLVAYKVLGPSIWVADPNDYQAHPRERVLTLRYGKFEPYRGFENVLDRAAGTETEYKKVSFLGQSALTYWHQVGEAWDRGAEQPGYPAYGLRSVERDASGNVIREADLDTAGTLRTSQGELELRAVSDEVAETRVSLRHRELLDASHNPIPLAMGENRVGVLVEGKATWVDAAGQAQSDWRWLGFDWITVIRE